MTRTTSTGAAPAGGPGHASEIMENPWPALWAVVLGFFMLLVDTSILTVATPAIMRELDAGVNEVIWVTSAYLLAYVVPLLIAGRLGDRFGIKRVYLVGLVIFTLSSLWCGLADSIGMLIAARVAQGIGAAIMSPQTMAVITRVFPSERRGQAMALWGAAAGLATLVGPLLGGVLVDHLGWAWIFFVNVPVGVVAFVLAWRLVPDLAVHAHLFDWLGVALFGIGMFAVVLGIQEAGEHGWGPALGDFAVWQLVVSGLGLLSLFIFWQSKNTLEPLLPLSLFGDRNFSVSNLAIACVSFSFVAMGFPFMLYAQAVRGWSPTAAGLLMAPLALGSLLLARPVGRLTDRVHPRIIVATGFALAAVAMVALIAVITPTTPVWVLVIGMFTIGCGAACLWGPLSATANRNLPMHQAGAGAGVYNTTRQVGAVLGSAAVALLLDVLLRDAGLAGASSSPDGGGTGAMPQHLAIAYTDVFRETLMIVPVILAIGFAVALFLVLPKHLRPGGSRAASAPEDNRDVPYLPPSGGAGNGSLPQGRK